MILIRAIIAEIRKGGFYEKRVFTCGSGDTKDKGG